MIKKDEKNIQIIKPIKKESETKILIKKPTPRQLAKLLQLVDASGISRSEFDVLIKSGAFFDVLMNTSPELSVSTNLDTSLDRLSEGKYYSPEKIDKLLKTIGAGLSREEISRLRSLLPKELSVETLEKLERLKSCTEGDVAPILMQTPSKFIVKGNEIPFTLKNLAIVWENAKGKADVKGETLHGMYLGDCVTRESRTKVFEGDLKAYTPRCLKDSKDKTYDDQLKYQQKLLGAGHEIDERMFFAMLIHYLATSKTEILMDVDFMRLNTLGTDGDPLSVPSFDGGLYLFSSLRAADGGGGVGASLGISS